MKYDEIPEQKISYPSDWIPEEFYAHRKYAEISKMEELIKLIDKNVGETEFDKFITKNINLLPFILMRYNTGHHHSWVIPKKIIKSKRFTKDKGEIPDFLMAGSDSDGMNWFAIELKGINEKIFTETKKNIYFSNVVNKGINQLMEYLITLDRDQAYLRDTHKLKDLSNPKGILIVGREEEMKNKRKQELKSAWNKNSSRIEIRTYDSFKRIIKEQIEFRKNPPKNNSFNIFLNR